LCRILEMGLLAEAGIPTDTVLQMSTIDAAKALLVSREQRSVEI
jgi:imidazolonepropionase-like amidohydrolase